MPIIVLNKRLLEVVDCLIGSVVLALLVGTGLLLDWSVIVVFDWFVLSVIGVLVTDAVFGGLEPEEDMVEAVVDVVEALGDAVEVVVDAVEVVVDVVDVVEVVEAVVGVVLGGAEVGFSLLTICFINDAKSFSKFFMRSPRDANAEVLL